VAAVQLDEVPCWCSGVGEVSEDVTITLSSAQVASVLRDALGGEGLVAALAGLRSGEWLDGVLLSLLDDDSLSRSTVRALMVLSVFPADGAERKLTGVAKQLGMSASTTHRYVHTWVAVGLLEQSDSRRYRRVSAG
jgi:hypothetical protein